MEDVLILGACRTPIGSLNGALASCTAPHLGAKAIAAAVAQAGVKPEDVGEVVLGNVVSAGIGQAPARQAMIAAGLPPSTGATTVDKVCGSGLKAVMMAAQSILLGECDVAVAGGMESMSKAPFLLDRARSGYRLGHGQLLDSIIKDGLWDPYHDFHMGMCGEMCAEKYAIDRRAQDEFALESYRNAQQAQRSGAFDAELADVEGVKDDEEPGRISLEKVPKLKPAFKPGGTITAANASKISDGAAAVVLAAASASAGRPVLARVKGWATFSQEPAWFTTAPVGALQKLLVHVGWRKEDVDLYELNEAFAVVPLAAIRLEGIPREKVNVHGGAIALGHPLGASGARILVTLVHALKRRGLRRGVAAICLGGGEAVAMAVERE